MQRKTYDQAELTKEQLNIATRACDDAHARAFLRKLRALIVFAQSEPEFIPRVDEDTGEIGPQKNWRPAFLARHNARTAMGFANTWAILKEFGWSEETAEADWQTMLNLLPADKLRQDDWNLVSL